MYVCTVCTYVCISYTYVCMCSMYSCMKLISITASLGWSELARVPAGKARERRRAASRASCCCPAGSWPPSPTKRRTSWGCESGYRSSQRTPWTRREPFACLPSHGMYLYMYVCATQSLVGGFLMLWSSQEGQRGGGWAAGHGAESAVIPRGAATSTLHHCHVTLT